MIPGYAQTPLSLWKPFGFACLELMAVPCGARTEHRSIEGKKLFRVFSNLGLPRISYFHFLHVYLFPYFYFQLKE